VALYKETIRIQNDSSKSINIYHIVFKKNESINFRRNIHIIKTGNMHLEEIVLSDKLGVSTLKEIFLSEKTESTFGSP
jgi:hypothetical protein